MRNHNKIVSLVLVLALLLGVLVIVPSAETPVAQSVTPTATAVETESGSVSVYPSDVEGNLASSTAGLINWDANAYGYYVVTPAEGESYAMLVAEASMTTGNHFINVGVSGSPTLNFASGYYVIDVDIASESAAPAAFGFNPIIGFNGSSSGTRLDPDDNYRPVNLDLTDGDWHHFVIVGDLAANVQHVFLDGELVHTTKKAFKADKKEAQDKIDANTAYQLTNVRIDIGGNIDQILGANICFDNFAVRTFDSDDSLKAAIDAGNVDAWDKAASGRGGSLPVIATVNGVDYSNATAVNIAFNGITAVTAELKRECAPVLTVNCDATVETNGFKAPVAGTDVTVTTSGTVNTYDAPFSSSVVEDAEGGLVGANLYNATADSSSIRIDLSGNYTAETVVPYLVTDKATGNQYVDIRPGASFTTGTVHNHFNWVTANTNYQTGTYFITEFDAFTESEVMSDLYIGVTARNGKAFTDSSGNNRAAGSNMGGAGRYIKNWKLPVGEWVHVAMIGDVDTNTIYVYVNGILVDSSAYGLWASAMGSDLTNEPYFQGIRVNVNSRANLTANQNFAMDNISYKLNLSDAWLDANIGAASLEGWSGNSYELPAAPALAIVDGKVVNSAPELNTLLSTIPAKQVELYRDARGVITVNCDAVIETHGFTAPTAGANVTVTNEGTVYTYDASFVESKNYEASSDANAAMTATKLDNSSNLWGYLNLNFANSLDDTAADKGGPKQGASAGITTNNYTGNSYVDLGPGQSGSNFYVTISPVASSGVVVSKGATNLYYVLDLDIAFYGDVSSNFGWYAVCRYNGSGRFGSNVNGGGQLVAAVNAAEKGVFHHFTTVLDFDNNKAYTFMNGVLVVTTDNAVYGTSGAENYAANDGKFKFEQFRMFPSNVESLAFDNVSVRKVADNAGVEAAITAGSLANWAENVDGTYTESTLAPIANVNGAQVTTVSALNAALTSGDNNVELLCSLESGLTLAAKATVVTNGVSCEIKAAPGYVVKDNGNGTVSVAVDTSEYKVTVNLNGAPVFTGSVVSGTDAVSYLAANSINSSYVVANGKIYLNPTWETAPGGTVVGDVVYNATAEAYTGLYIAIKDGAVIDAEQTVDGLYSQISNDYDVTIILNRNLTSDKLGKGLKKNTTVDLNGHTLTFAGNDGANHDFVLSGSAAGNLTFKNGTVVANHKTNTQWLFFCNYDYTGTVIVDNVHLVLGYGLANLRGGNITVKNSTVDAIMTLPTPVVMAVENYNGNYTKMPTNTRFENCVINHRNTRDYNRDSFVYVKANADDQSANTVTFVNCVISDRNTVTFATPQGFVKSENEYTTVEFAGCELRVQKLVLMTAGVATLLAGNSVADTSVVDGCTVAEGLELVHSGKANAPYVYASEYATVTWPNGDVEKWADGTTPVSAANPLAKVQTVKAGESYTFENAENAPCSIKANLSLANNLVLNVYIPTSATVDTVTIGGVVYDLSAVETTTIKLVPYYVLSYELDVTEAAGDVTVVVDGMAFNLSVVSYAKLVYAQYADDAKSVALMSAILNYVKAAYHFAAVVSAPVTAEIDALLAEHPAAEANVAGTVGDMSAVKEYLSSAQLNLNGDFKLRFNVVDGADISALVFTVDGEVVAHEVFATYVEITLSAADMLKDITVTVGEKSGTYNLYSYASHLETLAASYVDKDKENTVEVSMARYSLNLIKAMYAYAEAAAAYKA